MEVSPLPHRRYHINVVLGDLASQVAGSEVVTT